MRFDSQENIDLFIKTSTEKTTKEWCEFFGCERATIERWSKRNGVSVKKAPSHAHNDETKAKIREKRKAWLVANPERHPWKRLDKFKSEPCENVKSFLQELGVEFIAEFSPEVGGRFFSIDIAIPDKMIAIEINGNQHYERDGSLKPYYQERHDVLESAGWTVYQIHYSMCFKIEKWAEFVQQIQASEKKVDFDYFNYKAKPKKEFKKPCSCGRLMWYSSISCKYCSPRKKKIFWPKPEEMKRMVWAESTTKIATRLGVSDNAVGKYCAKHGIPKPSRGYWMKSAPDRT
jgi:hypothetical protein